MDATDGMQLLVIIMKQKITIKKIIKSDILFRICSTDKSRFKKDLGHSENLSKIEIYSYFKLKKHPLKVYNWRKARSAQKIVKI